MATAAEALSTSLMMLEPVRCFHWRRGRGQGAKTAKRGDFSIEVFISSEDFLPKRRNLELEISIWRKFRGKSKS